MKWTATYNPYLNEWAIYRDGEIFCHVSDYDFAIFQMNFLYTISYVCPWTGEAMNG